MTVQIGRRSLAGLGAALALPGIAQAQAQTQMAIATGTTGGVYYPLGGALANYLSRGIPGMSATVEVTGGSVADPGAPVETRLPLRSAMLRMPVAAVVTTCMRLV